MTEQQRENCHVIIHGASASAAAIAGGMAQIPVADHALLVPLQIAMILGLGKVFNVTLTDSAAKGFILSQVAMTIGRTASQILVGWIPAIGNAINASTAAALTEAIGWAFVDHMNNQKK